MNICLSPVHEKLFEEAKVATTTLFEKFSAGI
jgi:hypothetical protein